MDKDRYFADRFDADGKFYVFDGEKDGAEVAGPFDEPLDAVQEAIRLNKKNVSYTITFDGEAFGWFQDTVEKFATPKLYAEITPVEGKTFDAFVWGVDMDYDDGNGSIGVVVRKSDSEFYPVGEPFTVAAKAIHIY